MWAHKVFIPNSGYIYRGNQNIDVFVVAGDSFGMWYVACAKFVKPAEASYFCRDILCALSEKVANKYTIKDEFLEEKEIKAAR